DRPNGLLAVRSLEGSTGIVAGRFDEADMMDLVITNSGANRFALLRGTDTGGLLNPYSAPSFATGVRPGAVVAGDFNHDTHLDLAILNEDGGNLSIFLGDGHGGFTAKVVHAPDGSKALLAAGNLPTGLSVADVNGDGQLDVLVGNEFGDVLTLLGKGDGTFQPYQRAEHNIALAVAGPHGDGRPEFIFANEARDHVSVQYSQPGQTFAQDRSNGLLAPGAVGTADLNGDGIPDLLVANSGGNNVLVYLGIGNGQFGAAHSFFSCTTPRGSTITGLN